jgi:protein-disulfide isomerase
MPIAVAGLAMYASLAGLSVMTGLGGASPRKWIGGLLLLLSLTVALCGLWFTGLQLFVLGKFCILCTTLHILGLSIAGVVIWGLTSRSSPHDSRPAAAPVAVAPRSNAVGVPGVVRPRAPQSAGTPISIGRGEWVWAGGGALFLALALAGGQVLFPAEAVYQTEVALKEPVQLGGADEAPALPVSGQAVPYQANRIATEIPSNDAGVSIASAEATADITKPAEPVASPPQPKRERLVKFLNGTVTLDVYQHPHLGNPEAPHVMLEFASYDCPHCHAMHRVLQRALRRYGDQVAIVVLPYPQEMECNKEVKDSKYSITGACATARMAVGVATIDPAKFAQFHDWLMAGKERPPSPSQVVARAYSLVERDRITTLREQLQKSLASYIDLYMKIKSKTPDPTKVGLPLLVVGDQVLSGELKSDDVLFEAWERQFNVKPMTASSPADLPAEPRLSPDA